MRDEPISNQGRSFASLVASGAPEASLIEEHAMIVERAPGGSSLIDVLDRVLDKGIVIDAWVRVSLVGIDLLTVGSRIVVASIDTHLEHSAAVGTAPASLRSIKVASPAPLADRGAALLGKTRPKRRKRPRL